MTIDRGRENVYAAEIAAFEGTSFEIVVAFDELLGLAERITSASWWPHGAIDVVPARRDARSSATRQLADDRPVVRLAAPQLTPATLVHELAHVLAGVGEGHGATFRRAHVDLAGHAFGAEPAEWLVTAYADVGLPLGDRRRWPAPPVAQASGGQFAL